MPYHILIAEDETVALQAVQQSLEALLPDAIFLTAENGGAAVALSQAEPSLEMAFLDIKMPVMDGITASQRIRETHPNCQIVFLTAYSDYSYMKQALHVGAVDYLLKPFTQTALASAVQKALGRLSLLSSERQADAEVQSQLRRLTQWVDDQVLLGVAASRQSNAVTLQQLNRLGIDLGSGVFAVLHCPANSLVRRVGGMLRGGDWGRGVRLFCLESPPEVFVLAVSPVPQGLAKSFSVRLERFCAKAKTQLSLPLHGACGYDFTQLELAQSACFQAYDAMFYTNEAQPFLRQPPDEALWTRCAQPFCHITSADEVVTRFDRLLQYLLHLQFGAEGAVQQLCRVFTDCCAACTPSVSENEQRALTERLSACRTREEVCGCFPLLASALTAADPAPVHSTEPDLRAAIEQYVAQHFAEELSLETIAAQMQYAPTYFSKLFRRLFGQTFVSYLTEQRLLHAQTLLLRSTDNVRTIAQAVGFHDAAYFTSLFRRTFGKTPSEFRAHAEEDTP